MKFIIVNYETDPSWVLDYTDDYFIFDRSDNKDCLSKVDPAKVAHTRNFGHCDYDKLCYLVDNYDTLPDIFFWGKGNLWKHTTRDDFEKILAKGTFAPIYDKNLPETRFDGSYEYIQRHGTDRDISYHDQGIFWEKNNSWYVYHRPSWRLHNFQEFCDKVNMPNKIAEMPYLPFAPGGNYILTKDRVYRYSRDLYDAMANLLPYAQLPAEADMCERTYYSLWK